MTFRSEVIRLRVMNENVAREISGNQKQLHNLDSAVKSRRAILKHLEYDVNVIEKVRIFSVIFLVWYKVAEKICF